MKPMEFEIDDTKWGKEYLTRQPPRKQTEVKNVELLKQINQLALLGVIRKSRASAWSQVHLTPKPNGKWRFTIDYRKLNELMKSLGWPIPNIKEMLQRLGSRHAMFFAVMDLTSGFHQAPLAEHCMAYTAFNTFCGIYEWTRLPMGIKGSPALFQQAMSEALAGLLYNILELYLDDIIVHGQDADSYIHNLECVFERLREKGLTLNPEKCRFGLEIVEYVGHMINKEGLSMSADKRNKVTEFPKPKKFKEMKSFLGLANYFRDHGATTVCW
jgi:hypothetical protein